MKLRFTPQAIGDLESISDYFAERNPAAGRRVRESILGSLGILSKFPDIGRRQTVEDVRKLITRKYAYLVYYSVDREAGVRDQHI
jgi:plasmid stabilization system protein ParE